MIDLTELSNELDNDPVSLGYAALGDWRTDDATLWAEVLNDGTLGRTVDRGVIPAHEIVESIEPTEWAGLSAGERERIQFIVSAGEVDVRVQNIRTAFATAFSPGTTTRAELVELQTRPGSRAEELWGEPVSARHVGEAANL